MATKVHIVQIAMSDTDGNLYAEYLDNMGRVWFDNGHFEYDGATKEEPNKGKHWVTVWEQVNLPDEPAVA